MGELILAAAAPSAPHRRRPGHELPEDPFDVAVLGGWFDEFSSLVDDIIDERLGSTSLERARRAWGTAAVVSGPARRASAPPPPSYDLPA